MWIKGETHWRRPDLIIFINGFPIVFIELKNSNIPVKNAYDINLKNYLKDIPYLFNYNQICVLSNGMETRLGSFAAGYEFFFEWLKVENEKENLEIFQESMPVGFLKYTCEKNPRIIYASEQMKKMVGFPQNSKTEADYQQLYYENIFLMIFIL